MIYTDTVTCEGCGAEIDHILCGHDVVKLSQQDPDYRICDACKVEGPCSDCHALTTETCICDYEAYRLRAMSQE